MSDAVTFEAAPALDPRSLAEAARAAILARFPRSSVSTSPAVSVPRAAPRDPRPQQHVVGAMNIPIRSEPNTLHRLRMWLRERYPQNTAKLVARDIEADPRTVENWLASDPQPPIWRHWEAMMQAYGPVFVMAVFAPPTERRREILAELDDLERRHRELHQTIRRLREAV